MKDIIEQIIEIDSLAFENKKNKEMQLKNKRQEYENRILEYRQAMLKDAQLESEKIISQISNIDYDEASKEKMTKVNARIEDKYSQIEDVLVKSIFKKLFAMEN